MLDSILEHLQAVGSSSETGPARAALSVGFVGYTILIYDYFCTLQTEVDTAWTRPRSIGLTLFFLNRYLPVLDIFFFLRPLLAGDVSQSECKIVYPTTFWLVTLGLILSQCILILRTYAIWGCRKLVLWIMGPFMMIIFSTMLAATSWKTYLDYKKIQTFSLDLPIPDALKCKIAFLTIDNRGRVALLVIYAMVFSGEALIVGLTIIRASYDVDRFTPRWVVQLYKNGILYCVCMLTLTLANISVVFAAPYAFKPVLLPMQRSLHSIFANRVMLLIFRQRRNNALNAIEDNGQQRPATFATSTMAVFTTANVVNLENEFGQTSWQTRAQLEWFQ
ncbi:hypothetical protein JR316_0012482 [Psilocybe cubensis]|uniref:Uncharacterized protein n=2 Tax=Psilocybe cubensis TaxID=181762 RepID=A0ACB8GI76_PSICU|nr:hypothetical protein JR316_0012482 [Psilocybe cubensis]KAH9475371.1 hypothetical protein JR316_0012482 [Psilocybe cubensis]